MAVPQHVWDSLDRWPRIAGYNADSPAYGMGEWIVGATIRDYRDCHRDLFSYSLLRTKEFCWEGCKLRSVLRLRGTLRVHAKKSHTSGEAVRLSGA